MALDVLVFFALPFIWYKIWMATVGGFLFDSLPVQICAENYHEATGLDPVGDPTSTAMMMDMGEL